MTNLSQAARAFDYVAAFRVHHQVFLQGAETVVGQVVRSEARERRQFDEQGFHGATIRLLRMHSKADP